MVGKTGLELGVLCWTPQDIWNYLCPMDQQIVGRQSIAGSRISGDWTIGKFRRISEVFSELHKISSHWCAASFLCAAWNRGTGVWWWALFLETKKKKFILRKQQKKLSTKLCSCISDRGSQALLQILLYFFFFVQEVPKFCRHWDLESKNDDFAQV